MSEWIITYDDDGNEIVEGEITRCKDCKWWDKKFGCEFLGVVQSNMENFYCAEGHPTPR